MFIFVLKVLKKSKKEYTIQKALAISIFNNEVRNIA